MPLATEYKLTQLGVLPKDWEVKPCSAITERIMVGVVIRPAQYYVKHGVPAFRSANIRESGISDRDLVFIDPQANATILAKSQVRTGDILTVRTGYPGTSAVVTQRFAGSNCIDILISRPSNVINPNFFAAWINSPFGKTQVLQAQGGLAQQHFNVGDLRNLLIAVPPLDEQRSIASALSDVDALIGALDRLIAKKRDLKQAAMKQLLTGQMRLPGFGGKWDVVEAGKVGKFRGGSGFPVGSQGDSYGDYPFFKVSDMNHDGNEVSMIRSLNWITEKMRAQIGAVAFPTGSIVFAKVGAAVFLERKRILTRPSCIDNNMSAFVFDPQILDPNFMHSTLLNTKLSDLVSTTALPSLNSSVLAQIRLRVPPLAEQRAITAVLADADAEGTALRQRRDKVARIKQGMMQELLTGRIRLV